LSYLLIISSVLLDVELL